MYWWNLIIIYLLINSGILQSELQMMIWIWFFFLGFSEDFAFMASWDESFLTSVFSELMILSSSSFNEFFLFYFYFFIYFY